MHRAELRQILLRKYAQRTLRATPNFVTLSLLISDGASHLFSGTLAILVVALLGEDNPYPQLLILPALAIGMYAFSRLYPGIGISPADELRRLSIATSILFLTLFALNLFLPTRWLIPADVLGLSWLFSLLLVPLGRSLTRKIGSQSDRWGIPVVILSNAEQGNEIAELLNENREAGFRPLAVLGTQRMPGEHDLIQGPMSIAPQLAEEHRLAYAILVFPFASAPELAEVVDKYCGGYQRLLLIPSLLTGVHIWVTPLDVLGNLGLEIKQNLLLPSVQWAKRGLDILTSLLVIFLVSPLMLFIAVAIYLDSQGPVFYLQERIGKGGAKFKLIKFRTMVQNADASLRDHLERDPTLKEEWDHFQKLSADPRVTRIGKWLRRWSLDELPQIFNVVQGDMSIVGPRPIASGQEQAYGRDFHLYAKVKPGLTGLWQVSGRNRLTFEERARLDGYYVRNWSPWLDIYVFAKTPSAILRGEGRPDQPTHS
jgi:Undecaprenyl-phosphate galactose phosphotransferase WbaP